MNYVKMKCRQCDLSMFVKEPNLVYTDIYGVQDMFHVGCWNNSIYGEVERNND